jgi:hypothetical protein
MRKKIQGMRKLVNANVAYAPTAFAFSNCMRLKFFNKSKTQKYETPQKPGSVNSPHDRRLIIQLQHAEKRDSVRKGRYSSAI